MEIDRLNYRNLEIKVFYNKETKCFSANSLAGSSNNSYDKKLKNFCHGYKTPEEAVIDVKKQIDAFLVNTPKTYKELSEQLTENLTWTGYEDCHLDEKVVKILVNNFITYQKSVTKH